MMRLFAELAARARALLSAARQDRETAEELRFHVERDVEERIRQGADPAAARRAALAALGGVAHATQRVPDARGIRPLQDLADDVRYTFRSLRRDPIYTAAAVLVLALGLGAGATVLAVANSVLFAPLPYPESHRLVRVGQLFQPNTVVWQLRPSTRRRSSSSRRASTRSASWGGASRRFRAPGRRSGSPSAE